MFDHTGAYKLWDQPTLTVIFEMDFTSGFSSVLILNSKTIVENSGGTIVAQTLDAGVWYNSRSMANYRMMYSTATLRHILNFGDRIFVDTIHNIFTPNSGKIAQVVMKGKFSIHAN